MTFNPRTSGTIINNNIIQNNAGGIILSTANPSSRTTVVTDNLFQNSSSFVINVFIEANNVQITNNVSTNNVGTFISLLGDPVVRSINAIDINGNTSTADGQGIVLQNLNGPVTINNNIFNEEKSQGILIAGAVINVTIMSNCIVSSGDQGVSIVNRIGVGFENADITLSPNNTILCNDVGSNPPVGLFVDAGAYSRILDATSNYFGPNLGVSPDNTIVDPDGNVDSSGTLSTPARVCPSTTCDAPPCNITCSSDITVTAPFGATGVPVTYPPPGVSIGCGSTVSCTPLSNSFFPLGVNVVTCSSTLVGVPSCSFNITVNSAAPPPPVKTTRSISSSIVLTVKKHHRRDSIRKSSREKKEKKKKKRQPDVTDGTIVVYPREIVSITLSTISALASPDGLPTMSATLTTTITFSPPSNSFFPLGLTVVVAKDFLGNSFSFFVNVVNKDCQKETRKLGN